MPNIPQKEVKTRSKFAQTGVETTSSIIPLRAAAIPLIKITTEGNAKTKTTKNMSIDVFTINKLRWGRSFPLFA